MASAYAFPRTIDFFVGVRPGTYPLGVKGRDDVARTVKSPSVRPSHPTSARRRVAAVGPPAPWDAEVVGGHGLVEVRKEVERGATPSGSLPPPPCPLGRTTQKR